MGLTGHWLGQFEEDEDDLSDYEHWEEDVPKEERVVNDQCGILWIQKLKGHGLPSMDIGKESDPYLIFNYQDEVIKTEYIDDEPNPVWPDTCRYDFDVQNWMTPMKIEVYDWDMVTDDDLIGSTTFTLESVLSKEAADAGVPVVVTRELVGTDAVKQEGGSISFEILFEPRKAQKAAAPDEMEKLEQTDRVSRITMEEKARRVERRISKENLDQDVVQDVSRRIARRLTQSYISAHHMAADAADKTMPAEASRRRPSRRVSRTSDPESTPLMDDDDDANDGSPQRITR